MTSCSTLIDIMHNIIDTFPVTHDDTNMISLIQSLIKVVNMWISQCYFPSINA